MTAALGLLPGLLPSLLLGTGAGTGAPPAEPRVSFVQVDPALGCVGDAVLADVDGDGGRDLVLATGECDDAEGPPPVRRLRVHLRRAGTPAFAARPDRQLDLVADVVAWAVADVQPAPGSELVLLSASRAVAVWWEADADEPRYAALCPTRLLWQPADRDRAFAWQAGVRDVDGDGLDDLLLPEPDGYRVALQRRGPDGVSFESTVLRPPPAPLEEEERTAARFAARGDELRPSFVPDRGQLRFLVEVHDRVPAPRLVDWDGDGDLDLVALSGRRLLVWLQDGGAFDAGAPRVLELPDRRARLLNPSYSVQLADLDGDDRADVLLASSRTDGDDVTSTLEVYLQAAGDGFLERAADKLRLQGFVDLPELADVDGDGRPDLAVGSLRPDLIGQLASGGSSTVDMQLSVFRGLFEPGEGRFQRPVALAHKLRLPGDFGGEGWDVVYSFFRDVDGDGRRDLLLRTEADRVVVRSTDERGRGLQVGDVLWELAVAEDARAALVEHPDGPALLVREETQIVHVEFP